MKGFYLSLRKLLANKISEQHLDLLPRGFQRIGDIIILNLNEKLFPYKDLIGREVLNFVPSCRTVCIRKGGIQGKFREPNIEVIAGDENTETIHREHGCLFKLDVKKVMFAKGNVVERLRLAKLVKENEIVVDMFAGIGYFSIVIGKHSKPEKIYAIELNKVAYNYLVENIKLNRLEKIITPIYGDCMIEAPKLGKIADRVIMGYLPPPLEFIPAALKTIKPSGVIHYEALLKKGELVEDIFKDIEAIVLKNGRKAELLGWCKVKSYAPYVDHIRIDLRIY
ncbi:MAG: class I SAM-dependent methyltransferase [Candidatus Odinarchaeia archaeon]